MLVISNLLANSQCRILGILTIPNQNSQPNGEKSCNFSQKMLKYSQACEPIFIGFTGFLFLGGEE